MNNYSQEAKTTASRLLNNFERGKEQNYWYANRKKLLHNMVDDDISRFLDWEVIRHTMYVHGTDYVKNEFMNLRFSADFVRWSDAIKETSIGNPIPAPFYPNSSENLIHHAYHIHTFEHTAKKDITQMNSILEFGGGYGSMCRLFRQLGYKGNYVIFDLPEFVVLQKYFLRSHGYVVWDTLEEFKRHGGIYCMSAVEELDKHYDLFIATWSISETSFDFRNTVLNRSFSNYVVAYQDDFFGVMNHDYFNPYMAKVPINWKTWKIEHLHAGQFYMMGWR